MTVERVEIHFLEQYLLERVEIHFLEQYLLKRHAALGGSAMASFPGLPL
jgi:hypothetical protein